VSVSVNDGDFKVCSSTEPQHGENPCGVHVLWRVEWDCWECWECHISAPNTPIIHRVRTPGLVLPRGVRQISTGSKLLSAVLSGSRALQLHLHRLSILYEPTVHLTGSDSCLIVISASLYRRDYPCR
jgi:hypothetical protein